MKELQQLIKKIDSEIDEIGKSSNGNNIFENLNNMGEKKEKIEKLISIYNKFVEYAEKIQVKINNLKNEHYSTVDKVQDKLNILKLPRINFERSFSSNFKSVDFPKLEDNLINSANSQILESSSGKSDLLDNLFVKKPPYSEVFFQKNLSLRAIKVDAFSKVKKNGELHYVMKYDHFAIYINDTLFHGNIGKIYTDDKNPNKIRDCRYGDECTKIKKCDFYHDPLKNDNSKDIRNYISSNIVYMAPSNRQKTCYFGSIENLSIDLANIDQNSANIYHDYTMHRIICSMLLKKYKNRYREIYRRLNN